MSPQIEIARAKINLTLHVGQAIPQGRFEGYHPVDSLVVFADFGDVLTFTPRPNSEESHNLQIKGEFSEGLSVDKNNLILKALHKTNACSQNIFLEKVIPVSAGLGGGSANAAAALRLFDPDAQVDDAALGADIAVCRQSRTALMSGIGEQVDCKAKLGQVDAVIVNPRIAVSTAAIFNAFDYQQRDVKPEQTLLQTSLIESALLGKNDLQPIAETIEPVITQIIDAINQTDSCLLARMSGSGASCFGLYETTDAAHRAAELLRKKYPSWWVRACKLGDPDE